MVASSRLFHTVNKKALHNICSILKMRSNALFLLEMFYFLGSMCRAALKTKKYRVLKTMGTCAVHSRCCKTWTFVSGALRECLFEIEFFCFCFHLRFLILASVFFSLTLSVSNFVSSIPLVNSTFSFSVVPVSGKTHYSPLTPPPFWERETTPPLEFHINFPLYMAGVHKL